MKKWEVSLTDGFTDPYFTSSWDIELIGDKLRIKFAEYLKAYKEKRKIITGGREQIRPSEVLKSFMLEERVNLVNDEVNGGLKSVFIIKKGDTKTIDDRAKQSLATRFEAIRKKTGDIESDILGFMKFTQVGGELEDKKPKDLKIEGTDVQYGPKSEKEEFVCKVCGKKFRNKFSLTGHMKTHNTEKKGADTEKPKIETTESSGRTTDKKK